MSYSIRFLNNTDFEKLPAKGIESKIGVAYPETGEAFVRSTGVNVVDVFTALHELEHLKGNDLDEHFDSENRCYYKDFQSIMDPIASIGAMIPGPWQVPSMAYGGYRGATSMMGGNKGQQPQQQMGQQSGMPAMSMPEGPSAPNTIQTGGGIGQAGGLGRSGSAMSGIKSLSQTPQFGQDIQNQQYGNTQGRNPLSMFGGM